MYERNIVQLLRMSHLNKEMAVMAGQGPGGPRGHIRERALLSGCCCVNSAGCRKRWIHTAAVSEETLIVIELSLSETPDLNPITAAAFMCSV